jgi:hypothetical protein
VKKVGVGAQDPLVTWPSPNGRLVMLSHALPDELLGTLSVPNQSAWLKYVPPPDAEFQVAK